MQLEIDASCLTLTRCLLDLNQSSNLVLHICKTHNIPVYQQYQSQNQSYCFVFIKVICDVLGNKRTQHILDCHTPVTNVVVSQGTLNMTSQPEQEYFGLVGWTCEREQK